MIIDDHGDESDSDDEELSEEYKEVCVNLIPRDAISIQRAERPFIQYLHLLQNLDRGRTLDDEGIRKLVAQLHFVSPEEREIAKEQTDVRIWCRMVFAGIRATEARNIKGTKIGPRDIRDWDAIPVKTVSPVRFCINGLKIVLIGSVHRVHQGWMGLRIHWLSKTKTVPRMHVSANKMHYCW